MGGARIFGVEKTGGFYPPRFWGSKIARLNTVLIGGESVRRIKPPYVFFDPPISKRLPSNPPGGFCGSHRNLCGVHHQEMTIFGHFWVFSLRCAPLKRWRDPRKKRPFFGWSQKIEKIDFRSNRVFVTHFANSRVFVHLHEICISTKNRFLSLLWKSWFSIFTDFAISAKSLISRFFQKPQKIVYLRINEKIKFYKN